MKKRVECMCWGPKGNLPRGLKKLWAVLPVFACTLTCIYFLKLSILFFIIQNYNDTVPPAALKSKALVTENEMQFFGNGYHRWSDYRLKSERTVTIRTAAENGILVFSSISGQTEDKSYMLIEMINGTVGFR